MRAIAIVGTGRLASALARTLGAAVVAVAGRDRERAAEVAALAGARSCSIEQLGGLSIDALWLATADESLGPLATEIAAMRASWDGVLVVHSSGALGVAPLEPFATRGASVIALHPNASLLGDLPVPGGTIWGLTPADSFARDRARELLAIAPAGHGAPADVDARLIGIAEERRALYHAAASVAANFSVTLFAMAAEIYERSGVEPAIAARLVADFMKTSIARSSAEGPSRAITGPIARGDVAVVAAQRAALDADAPELAGAFAALAELTTMLFGPEGSHLARAAREAGDGDDRQSPDARAARSR